MVVTETRLTHLASIIRYGHFGVAAASLGISQPALSKSIQGLETALGLKLLDRQTDGVVPTVHGEIVMQYGTAMLNNQREMLANLRSISDLDSGQVRVRFGPYPSVISGYPAAGRLLAKHPHINLSLEIADWREVKDAVIESRVDFGVAEQDELETDTRFEFEILGTHRGRLFCDPEHPILRLAKITMADALQYPWAATRLPSRMSGAFPRQPVPAGHIDPLTGDFVPSVKIDLPICLSDFTRGKDVLVVGSLALVEQELAAGTMLPLPEFGMFARYGLLKLKSHTLSPAARAFIAEIRAVEAEFVQLEKRLTAKCFK
jgi:DNA-binding transcriptional LysR family regulator